MARDMTRAPSARLCSYTTSKSSGGGATLLALCTSLQALSARLLVTSRAEEEAEFTTTRIALHSGHGAFIQGFFLGGERERRRGMQR